MAKTSTETSTDLCEHGEIEVACLDCFSKPRKLAPQARTTRRTTKTPASGNDTIAPFSGALDMSLPVVDATEHFGNPTLPARIFPHHLRRGGWVYLRSEDCLKGRVKAKKMVWSETESEMAIEVDPETWNTDIDVPLGRLADQQRTGYRYLETNDDDSVTHFMGGRPVVIPDPEDEED